jgi:hypothetical protein
VLGEILQTAYRPVLNDLNLPTATPMQLNESFKAAGASGDTVRRCVSFYLAAAKDSGQSLSPYILTGSAAKKTELKAKKVRPSGKPKGSSQSEPELTGSLRLGWTQMLLSKFPSLDPSWPDDVKSKWFDAFDRLMRYGDNTVSTDGMGSSDQSHA